MTDKLRLWLALALLPLALAACNLGNVPETAEPLLPTSSPLPAAGKPLITIISPQDGDEFTVNEQILVSVAATDSSGVTGVQLVVNGAVVKRVAPANPAGETRYAAALDYTPRAAGEVNMQVIAFRGDIASDPAALRLTIVSAPTSPNPNPNPNPGGGGSGSSGSINIPNDGVCRALTNLNLNFRSQPNTSSSVITVLPGGTLAPVVGRLGDNSWWQISFNNQNGWVSAGFTTLSGNCAGVPVISLATATPVASATTPPTLTPVRTPTPTVTPVPALPDLLVTSIGGSQAVRLNGSSVTITYAINITNMGQGPAGAFTVNLSNNGTLTDTFNVSGLDRGQSISLTRDLTWTTAGTFNLRVDVDPDSRVAEVSDVNNRGDLTVTVSN